MKSRKLIVLSFSFCAAMAACNKTPLDADNCIEEHGCLNKEITNFLSNKCQEGKSCEFSFSEVFSKGEIDRIYVSNKFGAHPTLGACKNVPMSKEFSRTTVFGCEYAIMASGNKFIGYVRGHCDNSFFQLPRSDLIIFSDGFESAGISMDAYQKLKVERRSFEDKNSNGTLRKLNYYYLKVDKKSTLVLEEQCFHF